MRRDTPASHESTGHLSLSLKNARRIVENASSIDLNMQQSMCASQAFPQGSMLTRTHTCTPHARNLDLSCFSKVSHHNVSREAFGYWQADASLPDADGIFVRIGKAPHFELRVTADSLAGGAIANALGITPLLSSAAEGEEAIRKALKLALASQLTGRGVSGFSVEG